jgi:hypothetical protein
VLRRIGPHGWITGVDLAVIGKAVELELLHVWQNDWWIGAQLAKRFETAIAKQFGWIVSSAEESTTVAALLGRKQRRACILAIYTAEN